LGNKLRLGGRCLHANNSYELFTEPITAECVQTQPIRVTGFRNIDILVQSMALAPYWRENKNLSSLTLCLYCVS